MSARHEHKIRNRQTSPSSAGGGQGDADRRQPRRPRGGEESR